MTERFERSFQAGWGDMDFNAHMRNTAYLDRSGDVRMMFFQDHGFPASEFARLKVGPVIQRDEVEYLRELQLLEPSPSPWRWQASPRTGRASASSTSSSGRTASGSRG